MSPAQGCTQICSRHSFSNSFSPASRWSGAICVIVPVRRTEVASWIDWRVVARSAPSQADTLSDSMLAFLLAAPGSGKSALAPDLRRRLESWVVLDWDFLLEPLGRVIGFDIRATPKHWEAYDDLLLATVSELIGGRVSCVVIGARTPQSLPRWPVDAWFLLDCSDTTRAARLSAEGRAAEVDGAVADAALYRALGLETIETSEPPDVVAAQVEELLGRADARFREV